MVSEVARKANASWRGSIVDGEGVVSGASGAFGRLPFSLQTRIGDWHGETSPEELLAAAFGSCFSMAIAAEMTTRQFDLTDLDCWITCTEGEVHGGFAVTGLDARIQIESPGLNQAAAESLVADALAACPMAKAVAGNVPVSIAVEVMTSA